MDDMPARWPGSIREINDLSPTQKSAIYRTLLPEWIYPRFGINPQDGTLAGVRVIHVRCPAGSHSVEVSVYPRPGAQDPVLYLHMGDSFNLQLVVLLVIVNDPDSPRFNIDVDEHGCPIQLGTGGRNIPEEIRALRAGLGPGQIRRGLRIFRTALPAFDAFVHAMGHELYFVEPLFYHNAIAFERYGLAYSHGLQKMRSIHSGFQPGGPLYNLLTGESPFRQPDQWQTVLGRSWAIHDGILGEPFTGIQMYKRVFKTSAVDSFPGAHW